MRRLYPPAVEVQLQPLRARIAVFELERMLFWGQAERAVEQIEVVAAGTCSVVLDLHRVSGVDESAAVGLVQLARRLADRTATLLLAGPPGAAPCWPDVDRATKRAGSSLLGVDACLPDLGVGRAAV